MLCCVVFSCRKLYLVDLAGSENIKRSGAEGARQKEAGEINKSLCHLKTVIEQVFNGRKAVTYRSAGFSPGWGDPTVYCACCTCTACSTLWACVQSQPEHQLARARGAGRPAPDSLDLCASPRFYVSPGVACRNSKLTFRLQDALGGGNSKLLVIACISTAKSDLTGMQGPQEVGCWYKLSAIEKATAGGNAVVMVTVHTRCQQ